MVRKPCIPLLFVPFLTAPVAFADEQVGLRDVIQTAVDRNVSMRSAEADLDVAEGVYVQATGIDDWQLAADGSWLSQRTTPDPGAGFQQLSSLDELKLDGSIAKPFDSGGLLSLKLSEDYQSGTVTLFVTGLPQQDIDFSSHRLQATLNFTQPLLKGFGYNASRGLKRRAEAQLDAATLDRENLAAGALRDVVQAYWELAYATQELAIRRQSLELAQEQLRITQARVSVGSGSTTDLAAVQQGIATRAEDVVLAEENVRARALELRQVAGMTIEPDKIALTTTDSLAAQPSEYRLHDVLETAVSHNPQIAALRARGKAARIDVEVGENGMLPQLDLNASFGPTGFAPELGDALDRLGTFKDWTAVAGVTFTLPVGRHAAKGQLMQARGSLKKIKVSEDDVLAQIRLAVARDVDLLAASQQRIQLGVDAVKYAQVNLDAEKARFGVGRSTNYDVLKRQEELAQSQLRQARATADYLKAVAVLQALTGEILPVYGVKLRKG